MILVTGCVDYCFYIWIYIIIILASIMEFDCVVECIMKWKESMYKIKGCLFVEVI